MMFGAPRFAKPALIVTGKWSENIELQVVAARWKAANAAEFAPSPTSGLRTTDIPGADIADTAKARKNVRLGNRVSIHKKTGMTILRRHHTTSTRSPRNGVPSEIFLHPI